MIDWRKLPPSPRKPGEPMKRVVRTAKRVGDYELTSTSLVKVQVSSGKVPALKLVRSAA